MNKIRQFLFRLVPACFIGAIIGVGSAVWFGSPELVQEPSFSFRTDHYHFELFDGLTFDDVESLAQAFELSHDHEEEKSTVRIWADQTAFLNHMEHSTGELIPSLRVYSPTDSTLCVLLTPKVPNAALRTPEPSQSSSRQS